MRRYVAWWIAALTMTSTAVWAQTGPGGAKGLPGAPGSPHAEHGEAAEHGQAGHGAGHGEDGTGHGRGDGTGKGNGNGSGSGHDSDDDDDDAAAPPAITRTPAQAAKRQAVLSERRAAIEAAVHKNGKALTPAERQAIGLHWRHVMRLLRIRELAEEAKDTATVARVDALLERASKHFEGKVAKLNEEAPATDGGAK